MSTLARRVPLSLLAAALLLPAVAPAQDWAKTRLEASSRHREYVTLKHGDRSLQALVVYPEVKKKATVIVMIHEIFGLSDWAKEMADELAAAGYIVIAPDLLSGMGNNGGGSETFTAQDTVMKAVSALPPDQVTADLNAAADFALKLPAASGKLTVAGFCWGGGKSFAFATQRKDLAAAFVFYGPPPPDVSTVTAPVYGFYAANDARIDATIPATIDEMKAANKKYEPITYDNAGHGFMRAGEDPTATGPMVGANKKARTEAFTRLTTLLKQIDTKPAAKAINATPAHPKALAATDLQCHDMKTMSAGSM